MRIKTMPRYRYIRRNNFAGSNVPEKQRASMESALIDKNDEYMDLEDYAKLVEAKKTKKIQNAAPKGVPSDSIADKHFEDDITEEEMSSSSSTDENTEIVNSFAKNHQQKVPQNKPQISATDTEVKVQESSLYKLMTDPNLVENIRKMRQARKYVCQFCKCNFAKQSELNDHFEIRGEKDKITCCACDKTFTQKRYLRYHQRCHSDRNKFVCAICTREYSRLDNLTRHENFHTNPAKFPCSLCERHFARRDLLKKHEKCHENKNSFRCELCDKHFKGPVSLENHNKLLHQNI